MPSLLDGLISRQDIARLADVENLIFHDENRIGVLESSESIDVQACPGSGKTTLIAAKLMLLAKKWPFEDCGICVLSHTNVAKDEIIQRLKKSKMIESQNLLAYPHFIGTIQEFVGKYVAFPLIRSDGTKINSIDTDYCVEMIYSKLSSGTRAYIDKKSKYSNPLYNFDLDFVDGSIRINVPTFPKGSKSSSYQNLLSTRKSLISDGCFFYRDVFSFARKSLFENDSLVLALQRRFPCVFLDEMQDTQKFQDDILCEIFPVENPSICVQRFGDPDQAIFYGIGSEEPNKSFNRKSLEDMDFVIDKSHRFTENIAKKIAKLSLNSIPLETEISKENLAKRKQLQADGDEFENTILVFNHYNIQSVIPAFLKIVLQQFSENYILSSDFTVKVIGAVGNEITKDSQLKIGHYCPNFDKKKLNQNFQGETLIEAVRYYRQRTDIDWAGSYNLLLDCIVRFLRSANIRDSDDKYFNATTLRKHLIQSQNWNDFCKLFYLWLNPAYELDQDFWSESNRRLIAIFNLNNMSDQIMTYLVFSEPHFHETEDNNLGDAGEITLTMLPDNTIRYSSGLKVELSTIHGVKGETHDATLVLETKNYTFDLKVMLPYMTRKLPTDEPSNNDLSETVRSRGANEQFMRQFYVGMSRPKHLLCLAIHANHISETQERKLVDIGWKIQRV